jgi:hypothetical protein
VHQLKDDKHKAHFGLRVKKNSFFNSAVQIIATIINEEIFGCVKFLIDSKYKYSTYSKHVE